MIRKVSIRNYKSLSSVTVDLKPLTVIFGPNAAGKSNLFDAINLISRLVTTKNLKEAFEGHRGLPLESVHYSVGSFADLSKRESHRIFFSVDVALSDVVVATVEARIRELRQGIDSPSGEHVSKSRLTERYLRYEVELEVVSASAQMRVVNEKLLALRNDGKEKARNAFLEKVSRDNSTQKLSLRMEGQAHPTMHDIGLDYTIASTPLYAPHYPHLSAFREELSRWRFYYFEPRELMREGNAIADVDNIGSKGEELAAFYHTLSVKNPMQFKALRASVAQLLPRLKNLDIDKTSKGELILRVSEGGASFSNRLISEGTLRVLGLLAALSPTTGSTTIGYEEPENGVHPRRLSLIAELLKQAAKNGMQVLINTHSPILPTYFQDSELLVCRRNETGTEFAPFDGCGELFRSGNIGKSLEERIVMGEFGG